MGSLLVMFPGISEAQANREAAKLTREGAQAVKNKEWDRAVDLFRRAAELDRRNAPSLSAALQQRATAYEAQQQYKKAIDDFRVIPLCDLPEILGISSRVRNWEPQRWGDWRLENAWLDTRRP